MQFFFVSVYHVYSVSTDSVLMWIFELQYVAQNVVCNWPLVFERGGLETGEGNSTEAFVTNGETSR